MANTKLIHTPCVELSNISKKYGEEYVIRNLSIRFDIGNIYLIIGSNGCGKTTLIKIVNKLIYPNEGNIRINGQATFVPDKMAFPKDVKLIKYLELFVDNNFNYDKELEKWGIKKYTNQKLKKLSKGTLHKVLLIIGLNTNADIYFFDEPLNGLDDQMKKLFVEEVGKLKKQNKIVIIVTHFKELFEDKEYKEVKL